MYFRRKALGLQAGAAKKKAGYKGSVGIEEKPKHDLVLRLCGSYFDNPLAIVFLEGGIGRCVSYQ